MNKERLHGLDHLRTLAITLVFLFHYQIAMFGHPAWLEEVAQFGWIGVDLFFVLSGFLISSQLFMEISAVKGISLRNFFAKRFFRILPAFWLTTALYFFVPSFHERESLPSPLRFLTFTQNFGLNISKTGTFSHAWSLCVEEHFYLLFPLLVLALLRIRSFQKGYWILLFLFVAGFFIRHYNWYLYFERLNENRSWAFWYEYVYYPTYNRLDGLLIGVSIAAFRQFLPDKWAIAKSFGNWFFILGLLLLTVAYFLCLDDRSYVASVYGFPIIALGCGALVLAAVSDTCLLYKMKSKITFAIATLSYSIYLTHKGVVHLTQGFLQEKGFDINNEVTLLISMFASVLAAAAVYFIIEKSFLGLRKKLIA